MKEKYKGEKKRMSRNSMATVFLCCTSVKWIFRQWLTKEQQLPRNLKYNKLLANKFQLSKTDFFFFFLLSIFEEEMQNIF